MFPPVKLVKKQLLLAVAAVLLVACGHKNLRPPESAAQTEVRVYYVNPGLFSSASFPPPPAPDSMEQQADIAGVLAWQNKRTEEDCAKAERTADEEYDDYWGTKNPFGDAVPAEFKEFFSRLSSDFEESLETIKQRFHRPRPYEAYPEAVPCVRKSRSFSYPSGHASAARVTADVLSDIAPGRSDEFFAKAGEIARDRLVGGAHYPADIAAGKVFGDMYHAELLKSAAYREDIEKLKALVKH